MDSFPLYQKLPKEAFIGEKIPMDFFLQHGNIIPSVQADFRYLYINARSMFIFRSCSEQLQTVNTKHDQQHECHIIEFRVLHPGDHRWAEGNIVRAIFQSIPYYVFLVLRYKERVRCYVADTHQGNRNTEQNIVDRLYYTYWFSASCDGLGDLMFLEDVAQVISMPLSYDLRHELLKNAIEEHREMLSYDCDDDSASDLYCKEREISREELKRDIEFGYVPYQWRYEFGLEFDEDIHSSYDDYDADE
jgi:hypothetical protein